MNRYLPDNIDEFFFSQLKKYSEEPEENVWCEIGKKLSDNKITRRLLSAIPVIGTTAILLFLTGMPFFIKDNFIKNNTTSASKKISSTSNDSHKVAAATLSNTIETIDHFTGNIVDKQTAI